MTLAQSVLHANHINEAYKQHGIEPALLQSLIVVADDSTNLTALPEGAKGYAQGVARLAPRTGGDPVADPRTNIISAAWWLRVLVDSHGDSWAAITEYFGGGPRGQAAMRRIYYTELPKWSRFFA